MLYIVGIVSMMAGTVILITKDVRDGFGVAIGTVGALGVLTDLLLISKVRRRNFKIGLSSKQYRVCASCMYDLRGSPSVGQCPECGAEYTPLSLLETWNRILDSPA